MRSILGLLALSLLFASPAAGLSIDPTDVGSVFTLGFGGNVGGSNVAGLSAAADVAVVSFSGNQLVLDVTLTNTTNTGLLSSSRVSAFGFDVSSGVRGASTSGGGLFGNAVTGGRFPNGFGSLDVCIIDNRNNCSGGRNGGVNEGESGTTRLVLTLGASGPVVLTNFGVRYQDVGPNGLSGTGTPTMTPSIPEPGAAAVFAVGVALVGLGTRRRRYSAGR